MKAFGRLKALITPERDPHAIESMLTDINTPSSVPLPTPRRILQRREITRRTETPSRARRFMDKVTNWAHSLTSSVSPVVSQADSPEMPAPLVAFALRDQPSLKEEDAMDYELTDPNNFTPDTAKPVKTKAKAHRVTKSKKKQSGKKTAPRADTNGNRPLKKTNRKSPEVTTKTNSKSQAKRKRAETDDDSDRPQKQAKTKPSVGNSNTLKQSRSKKSHNADNESSLVPKKVSFQTPLEESSRAQSKKYSKSKAQSSRSRNKTSGSMSRLRRRSSHAQSVDDQISEDDGQYSEEESEYDGGSVYHSPEYQYRYSDGSDYDYVSGIQSPENDDEFKITRGERNDLLNELTRERGQRLVESMEIPTDSTIEEEQMNLFKKLAIRGCKPIMSGDWACDFSTLPNALFTRFSDENDSDDEEDLPFEPKWGSNNYAIKALQDVFALGGRVRDAEYLTISAQVVIERSIRKYMQRVMYSAGLHTVKSAIPVHTIISQRTGEDLVATLDRATKSLRSLMWCHEKAHDSPRIGVVYWPVFIGFVIAGPILCLLSLDGNPDNKANRKTPDEPVVRFMTHVDFSHAPFDVWNSLAAVICISHVRDTSLRLARLWEGSPTVHRFRDDEDEVSDEDL